MNPCPPLLVPDASPISRRHRWFLPLVLLILVGTGFAALRTAKHRLETAQARAERRQALRIQADLLQQDARSQISPGHLRSGPVWVKSTKEVTNTDTEPTADTRSDAINRPFVLAASGQAESSLVGTTGSSIDRNTDASLGKPPKNRGDDLFDACVVPKLVIEVPRAGVAALEANPRRYTLATVREGATVYTNVALKLKGSVGSFRGFGDTPSLTLNFEKFADGQKFHGLKKLHLNSSIQDRTYLCEKISRELFNAAGVPTPRAGHAIVTLNGRKMGLYVLLEGINRQFLKHHFDDPGGNVYDGRAGKDIGAPLQTIEGENPKDHARFKSLRSAAVESDLSVRQERLEKVLDVDRFLTFVALETILAHWDGYTVSHNNYRMFHDRSQDRLVFLAHGMDQVLGRREVDLVPSSQAIVARAVLEVPAFRARYRSRLAEVVTNVFQPAVIAGRIREIADRVSPVLATEDPEAASVFRRRSSSVIRRVIERSADVERDLFGAQRLAARRTNGTPSKTAWTPRLDVGNATLEQVRDEQGRTVLQVATTEGCTASWRSHAVLEKGRYRLEGRMRMQGVELDSADPRAGAGFRVSRQRIGQKNVGDRDWNPIQHEFDVSEPTSDVELICELRARKGVLWIDPESITLTRIDR